MSAYSVRLDFHQPRYFCPREPHVGQLVIQGSADMDVFYLYTC